MNGSTRALATRNPSFVKAFKCRLCDMFKQTRNSRLYQSIRARFFRSIKDEHTFHTQLNMMQGLSHRIAFARLVISSHRLKVETGSWTKPVTPVEDKLCDQCKKLWWRHQMEALSALLALCAGNSPVSGDFLAQRPVTRSFDVFFDLHPNKRLSKQSWGWWFETPTCPLWYHCNVRR